MGAAFSRPYPSTTCPLMKEGLASQSGRSSCERRTRPVAAHAGALSSGLYHRQNVAAIVNFPWVYGCDRLPWRIAASQVVRARPCSPHGVTGRGVRRTVVRDRVPPFTQLSRIRGQAALRPSPAAPELRRRQDGWRLRSRFEEPSACGAATLPTRLRARSAEALALGLSRRLSAAPRRCWSCSSSCNSRGRTDSSPGAADTRSLVDR
jgi:hypothetical protein